MPWLRAPWLAICHKNANLRPEVMTRACIRGGLRLSDRWAAIRRGIRLSVSTTSTGGWGDAHGLQTV
jgi:hypothetical protein